MATIENFGFALGDLAAAASIWRDVRKIASKLPGRVVRLSVRKHKPRARSPGDYERERTLVVGVSSGNQICI